MSVSLLRNVALRFTLTASALLSLIAAPAATAGSKEKPQGGMGETGLGSVYSQGGINDQGAAEPADFPFEPDTLGYPILPADIDPTLLGWPGEDGVAPAAGIVPMGVDTSTKYFNYAGIKVLVGVSADNACHLYLGNGSDICTFDAAKPAYYVNVLNDAAAKGLNKIRLWVDINGGTWKRKADGTPDCAAGGVEENAANHPFKYYPNASFPNKIGYWNLDERNDQFFANLRAVVDYAKQKEMFVEVTFFAPWVGGWLLGPWHPDHGRLQAQCNNNTDDDNDGKVNDGCPKIGATAESGAQCGNNTDDDSDGKVNDGCPLLGSSEHTAVGFTDRSFFVKPDTSPATGPQNEAMRAYQMNVIRWTVDELWSSDRIYWEIANEPESFKVIGQECSGAAQTAVAAPVAQWHEMMINELVSYEQTNYVDTGLLARRHLIAVQPFSTDGTNLYLPNGNISVINGHYTTIIADRGGMGAIQLARTYANQPRILGFNEGKISAIGGTAGTAGGGAPDSARAEGWEFMFYRGGTFDHFGYFHTSTYGEQVRQQLAALKNFMGTLPLRFLVTSASSSPGWVNMPAYPPNPSSTPQKYWAALQPSGAGTTIKYALYIHRSQQRINPTTGFRLSFQGYDPVFGSYTESPKLCLGSQPGTFLVEWIRPYNNTVYPGSSTIPWPGSTTCANGGPGSVTVNSPTYSYDIALRVSKQ
ncbi:MAG: hypothetical protein ACRDHY_12425 [Anaerolineales bacterium]